ncbi:MAG: 50S ribosomal protein L29 [Planctomycetota bacterium]|jgi:large subunit ribosomal protein L29|nr:MAG: 50S ribosomal protein L29 [Planctomycetota bacterium]
MAKVKEIRDMADEQIRLVWKDAAETLFRLRIQAQTEKLAAPTEMKKHRRTIARCQTILSQRGTLAPAAPVATVGGADGDPRHEKHAKKHGLTGRAKLKVPGKEGVAARRTFKKRTQSGT